MAQFGRAPPSHNKHMAAAVPAPNKADQPGLRPYELIPDNLKHVTIPKQKQDYKVQYLHMDGKTWIAFPSVVSAKLNTVISESKWSSARLTITGREYVFDIVRMVQIDVQTKRQRLLRWTDAQTGDIVYPPCELFALEEPFPEPQVPSPLHTAVGRDFLEALPTDDPEFGRIAGKVKGLEALHRIVPDAGNGFWAMRAGLFEMTARFLERKHGGEAKEVEAWHGTSGISVTSIIDKGFALFPSLNGRLHGHGVYFAPYEIPEMSEQFCDRDESGLSHMLLCRVLLGKVEKADPKMACPSSPEFDNGVDDVSNPQRYIVWTNNISTHVLPKYVVSFRTPA